MRENTVLFNYVTAPLKKKGLNLVLDLYVKLDDFSSETIGLHQVNGEVVISHAIHVTSHVKDDAECCVATRPMHVIV